MNKTLSISVLLLSILLPNLASANCNSESKKPHHNMAPHGQKSTQHRHQNTHAGQTGFNQKQQTFKARMAKQRAIAKQKQIMMQRKMQAMRESYQKNHPVMDRAHFKQHWRKTFQTHQKPPQNLNRQATPPCQVVPVPKKASPCQISQKPVAPVLLKDHDKDGVPNRLDMCPATATGTKVDALGCGETENLTLQGVHFKLGSDELKKESIVILNRVAATLVKRPDIKLEVAGHTDVQGDAEKNLDLSQRRATQVRNYLIQKGLNANSLTAKGYGESQLLTKNTSKADHAKNRRVELNRVSEMKILEKVVTETLPSKTKAPEKINIETLAPEAKMPETQMPQAPEKANIETMAPEAKMPETQVPEKTNTETMAPEAKMPETQVPEKTNTETMAPEVKMPEAKAPETTSTETMAPEAKMPEAKAPETTSTETMAPEAKMPETQMPQAPEKANTETLAPEAKMPETQMPQAPEKANTETLAPEAKMPETQMPQAPEKANIETMAPEAKMPETQMPQAPETTNTEEAPFQKALKEAAEQKTSTPSNALENINVEKMLDTSILK